MLKKIVQKIKSYDEVLYSLNHKFNNITDQNKDQNKDLKSLNILLAMFDKNFFLPITSWSLSPSQVHHICNDIVINKRKSIVELGSGYSTICIAQLLKINKIEARFFSIENNEEWIADLTKILISLDLSNYFTFIHAPLNSIPKEFLYKNQERWYDTSIISNYFLEVKEIDLLLVDGPFGGNTPFARYTAYPFFKQKLAKDFAIFFDDTNRSIEKEILAVWQKEFNFYSVQKNDYTYLSNKQGFDIYI